ncbi:MAG: hypothetical protein GF400_08880 [Candidatus Eisenbacteria bacterium]|nr:hypothetical protein [Candidatus Eisenbacteria bacterium]
MTRLTGRDLPRTPWIPIALALVALTVAVALRPLESAAFVLLVAATVVLVLRFGLRLGLWYALVGSIPLRQALAVDVAGTITLFYGDVLLYALAVLVLYERGLTRILKRSVTFRLGIVVLGLSVIGLYTATRVMWGAASVYRIVCQLTFFYLAYQLVRDGRTATRTLAAIVLGLAPAAAYGLYQAFLPVDAQLPKWGNKMIAYGLGDSPHIRIFSTFNHALRFSHYLTVGFGLALGLLASRLSRRARTVTTATGLLSAVTNLFTYSAAGLVGMFGAGVATAVVFRRRRVVLLAVPVALVVLFFASPAALVRKFENVVTGDAMTVAARMITYRQAVQVVRDHPFLGVGWGSIRTALEGRYRVTRAREVAFTAENYFLQRGLAMGVPGLLLSLAVCVLFFRNVVRSRARAEAAGWPRAALLIGGTAFYLQAQSFPAAEPASNYLLWILLAVAERMSVSKTDARPALEQPVRGGGQA